MEVQLGAALKGIVGDCPSDFRLNRVVPLNDRHFVCHMRTKGVDPQNVPVSVCWDEEAEVLSINVLFSTSFEGKMVWRMHDFLNESIHLSGGGFIGKASIRTGESEQGPKFLDLVYGWEISLTPMLLQLIDLGPVIREQMVRICIESFMLIDRMGEVIDTPIQ